MSICRLLLDHRCCHATAFSQSPGIPLFFYARRSPDSLLVPASLRHAVGAACFESISPCGGPRSPVGLTLGALREPVPRQRLSCRAGIGERGPGAASSRRDAGRHAALRPPAAAGTGLEPEHGVLLAGHLPRRARGRAGAEAPLPGRPDPRLLQGAEPADRGGRRHPRALRRHLRAHAAHGGLLRGGGGGHGPGPGGGHRHPRLGAQVHPGLRRPRPHRGGGGERRVPRPAAGQAAAVRAHPAGPQAGLLQDHPGVQAPQRALLPEVRLLALRGDLHAEPLRPAALTSEKAPQTSHPERGMENPPKNRGSRL
ncbi:hypothetical protein NDU88_006259 [Pleurodeles waltl]|uniref:Uncharacterized protein n=1 Tax=Pleurodeles waltl TaxID=8319 RepID=A0AAV7WDR7_PLEWA|nr:hypothetical protein NDU88_006259 [Pleurodeles waltl]